MSIDNDQMLHLSPTEFFFFFNSNDTDTEDTKKIHDMQLIYDLPSIIVTLSTGGIWPWLLVC